MTSRNGLLAVDKSRGMTSHDVVARVRRLLSERRVGHAGTLDPLATGLLILGVGASTRLLRFAQAGTKTYSGTARWGIATNTLDADGEEIARAPLPTLDAEALADLANSFVGDSLQTPPMVSAVKVNGQRLYELARAGVEVERDARPVHIDAFTLRATADPEYVDFTVVCSPGTYVRVLLSDLATRAGSLAHLTALRREASGTHGVSDALSLEDLAARLDAGREVLLPPRAFVEHLAVLSLSDDDVTAVRQGRRVRANAAPTGEYVAGVNVAGELVAVLAVRGHDLQPEVVMSGLQ